MANRERGEVGFEADGKEWTLRYSINAMCELEDALKLKTPEVIALMQDESGVGLKSFRAVFWAGLIDRKPDATVELAGELIGELGLPLASQLVGEAMEAAFPTSPKGDTVRPLKGVRSGTGRAS